MAASNEVLLDGPRPLQQVVLEGALHVDFANWPRSCLAKSADPRPDLGIWRVELKVLKIKQGTPDRTTSTIFKLVFVVVFCF